MPRTKASSERCFQWFAGVNCRTCELCLARHGEILRLKPEDAQSQFQSQSQALPPLHAGCRCHALEFPVSELKERRRQASRMRAKAQAELQRRQRFRAGLRALAEEDPDPQVVLAHLREAARIDVYIEELESLCREHGELLRRQPDLARRLGEIFLEGYALKLDRPRYQVLPEGLFSQLEQGGRRRIRALFGASLSPHKR